MFRKIVLAGLCFALLASPVLAVAQSADTSTQIAALQARVQALLAEIAQLQSGTQQTSCVDVHGTLTLGSNDGDVTNLQNYLIAKGDLDAQYVTGYYGFITAQAVGKLQMVLGIVSSANDTAYGIFGPKTRAAISCSTTPAQTGALATIDSDSLHATIPLTLSGDAKYVDWVIVSLYKYTPARAIIWEQIHAGDVVPVINGKWSYTVDVPDAVSPGDKVIIADLYGNQLTEGILK